MRVFSANRKWPISYPVSAPPHHLTMTPREEGVRYCRWNPDVRHSPGVKCDNGVGWAGPINFEVKPSRDGEVCNATICGIGLE